RKPSRRRPGRNEPSAERACRPGTTSSWAPPAAVRLQTPIPLMTEQLSVDVGDGAVLRGDRWPGEGPTVVLLHAGIADRRSWQSTATLLAPRHVVAYDQRGFGESSPATASFQHTDDLRRVLDVVSPNAPVVLVGSS